MREFGASLVKCVATGCRRTHSFGKAMTRSWRWRLEKVDALAVIVVRKQASGIEKPVVLDIVSVDVVAFNENASATEVIGV